MTFKLTERDKKLLTFLAVFLLLAGFCVFLILPAMERREELKLQITEAQEKKDTMTAAIDRYPALASRYEELKKSSGEVLEDYYPLMTSQEIDREITGIVVNHQTEAINLNIVMDEEAPELALYYAAGETAEETETEEKEEARAADIYHDAAEDTPKAEEEAALPRISTLKKATVTLAVKGSRGQLAALADYFIMKCPGIHMNSYAYSEPTEKEEELPVLNLDMDFYMCDKEKAN